MDAVLLPVKVLTWTGLQLPAALQDPLVKVPLLSSASQFCLLSLKNWPRIKTTLLPAAVMPCSLDSSSHLDEKVLLSSGLWGLVWE